MGTDRLRVESNERVDIEDFRFLAGEGIHANLRQLGHKFLIEDSVVNNQDRTGYILSGFEISNPAANQLQVTKGKAILSQRLDGTVYQGVITTEGDATKIIDINSYAAGSYNIYIRFEEIASNDQGRIFWNSTGLGSEYVQSIPTRHTANWALRVEASSPGSEWLKIGTVSNPSMAITDERPFYFEGTVDSTFASGWSSDGDGGANDRSATRETYGIKDLHTFIRATKQCLEDIKGRGLKRWWDRDIGGMNIGFDANPTSGRLAIGDANFNFRLDSSNPAIWFDSATTDDNLIYDRTANTLTLKIEGSANHVWAQNSFTTKNIIATSVAGAGTGVIGTGGTPTSAITGGIGISGIGGNGYTSSAGGVGGSFVGGTGAGAGNGGVGLTSIGGSTGSGSGGAGIVGLGNGATLTTSVNRQGIIIQGGIDATSAGIGLDCIGGSPSSSGGGANGSSITGGAANTSGAGGIGCQITGGAGAGSGHGGVGTASTGGNGGVGGDGGIGLDATGGDAGSNGNGGIGLRAVGGSAGSISGDPSTGVNALGGDDGGLGVIAIGGSSTPIGIISYDGTGLYAIGESKTSANSGFGIKAFGGDSTTTGIGGTAGSFTGGDGAGSGGNGGPGLYASGGSRGSASDYDGVGAYLLGSSNRAPLRLDPQGTAPSGGKIGDLYMSTVGKLYTCTTASASSAVWTLVGAQT